MSASTFWDWASTLMGIGTLAVLVWKMTCCPVKFTLIEMLGMGLTGAGCLLTLPTTWFGPDSPFDGWSGALFRTGVFIYFLGRMTRHWWNNRAQWDRRIRKIEEWRR